MAAQEDQGALAQMAEWLGLKDKELESFVNEVISRLRHEPILKERAEIRRKQDSSLRFRNKNNRMIKKEVTE